jgi:hypothetical protein
MEKEKIEGAHQSRNNNSNIGGTSRIIKGAGKSIMGINDITNNKANDDLISFLEHKLEEIEKKLHRTQSEYELL